MELFELIKQDHEKVKDIFEQIEAGKSTAKKTRQNLFERLYKELDVHMRAEEDVVYPALKQSEEANEKMLEAIEEHHVARLILDELKKLEIDDERWEAKIMVLKENIEHHIEEEEGPIFEFLEDICEQDQLEDISKQFQADKKQIKAKV